MALLPFQVVVVQLNGSVLNVQREGFPVDRSV